MNKPIPPLPSLSHLIQRYGEPSHLTFVLSSVNFPPLDRGRHGEVAMVIRRPSGRVLLQTKSMYPPGIFRIPTGGIKEGEDIGEALFREVHEETNLAVEVERFLAVITYLAPDATPVFRTYVFALREEGGELLVNDVAEEISQWREVEVEELQQIAAELRAITGEWALWGKFRAVVAEAVADLLRP